MTQLDFRNDHRYMDGPARLAQLDRALASGAKGFSSSCKAIRRVSGIVRDSQLLAALLLCLISGCEYEGSDAWLRECAARGGHLFEQAVYKGTVYLCLTQDGRIIEIEAP